MKDKESSAFIGDSQKTTLTAGTPTVILNSSLIDSSIINSSYYEKCMKGND